MPTTLIAGWVLNFEGSAFTDAQYHLAPFLSKGTPHRTIRYSSEPRPASAQVLSDGIALAESSDGTLTVWAAQDESAIVVGLLFQAIRHGAAVLHSSGFVFREKAILVVGESGAGKSTLATLLADCPLLSDEFNIVERRDKDLIASATPLRSSSPRLPSRLSAPIGFVLFPVKDTRDFLVRLEPSLALARLGPHAVIPGFTEQRPPFALLASIAREVPAFEFHFRKDPSCRRLLDELPLP